ncbi:MAG TPA: amino acid permease [Acidobacteriota bacterium]|nr:amino acid permease [Acidobacteriota bacterium]
MVSLAISRIRGARFPLGTLAAAAVGMVIYVLVVIKLVYSLPPEELAADQLAMSRIALWGPIIPIGLGAATLSSAIGSILIAPRTLQALAGDKTFPTGMVNRFLSSGRGPVNEPLNATLATSVIVIVFVSAGSVNFVAQIISMFFMITYGTLCLVSFLEHFAGNPSYRPTFRSKWYWSLIGSIACFVMMFQMAPVYALVAVVVMTAIYMSLKRGKQEGDLSAMLKGALFQLTRKLQILIQRKQVHSIPQNWRPSFIAISASSVTRLAPFDLLRWIASYYGFGSYIHFVKGKLNKQTQDEAKQRLEQLIRLGSASRAEIYVDTIISPSFRTAVAQIVQIPGISGMENNSILFEFPQDQPELVDDIIDGCQFAAITDLNICILRSSERHFGYKRDIHIWLTQGDYRNANLMIILAYIIIGHDEWKDCEISLFVAVTDGDSSGQLPQLNKLIDEGRIPISRKNVRRSPWKKDTASFEDFVTQSSGQADLVIMGFSLQKLTQEEGVFIKGFTGLSDVLFVRAGQRIVISEPTQ